MGEAVVAADIAGAITQAIGVVGSIAIGIANLILSHPGPSDDHAIAGGSGVMLPDAAWCVHRRCAMTRKSLIVASSAVALATTLWADSASAYETWLGLIHDSENQNLCINNPYQSSNDGTELVANEHCNYSDPGSLVSVVTTYNGSWNDITLSFRTGEEAKCVDLRNSELWDGNWITIYTCNGTDAQRWDWDGTSFHYHANPAYCISVHSDGRIILWHCIGQGNQKFVLTEKPSQAGVPGGEGGSIGGCPWEMELHNPGFCNAK
jgi:Ricin-type beta-trefoil lectin domain